MCVRMERHSFCWTVLNGIIYVLIILIVSTNYIFVHLLVNKVYQFELKPFLRLITLSSNLINVSFVHGRDLKSKVYCLMNVRK